jgi:hypothetical protein
MFKSLTATDLQWNLECRLGREKKMPLMENSILGIVKRRGKRDKGE